MDKELITVIIPVYNVEKYLDQTIESIKRQTYDNIDILLIDDGSTDSSGDICEQHKLKDNRIRVIHQKNQGIAYVRNLGVKRAMGNVLCWVDSDDLIAPNMIEKLYELLQHNDADISICEYTQGSDRSYEFTNYSEDNSTEIMDSKQALEKLYNSHHDSFVMAASWGKLIRKKVYDGLRYPDGLIFEDIYMSHRLLGNCKRIVYTTQVMYYYYQWPDSILGKKLHLAKLDYLGAFEDRIRYFERLKWYNLVEMARLQYLHSLIWEYSRAKDILHNKKKVKEIINQYRQYYVLGSDNKKQVAHENKYFMFMFYISPLGVDLYQKIKGKIGKKYD